MGYTDEINDLVSRIPVEVIDFSKERHHGAAPTLASSEFITNKQQGILGSR